MNPYPKSPDPRRHPAPLAAAQAADSVHASRATGRASWVLHHSSPVANLHFLVSIFPFPSAPRENYARSNPHNLQLETSATSRKQTVAANSNRHKFAVPARPRHPGRAASTYASNPWDEIRSSFAAQSQPRKKVRARNGRIAPSQRKKSSFRARPRARKEPDGTSLPSAYRGAPTAPSVPRALASVRSASQSACGPMAAPSCREPVRCPSP